MMKKTFFCCFILFFVVSGWAQKAYDLSSPAAVLQVPRQDKQRLLDEDEKNGKGRLRCAVLLPFQMAFPKDIVPEKVADGTVWRMKIEAEDAEAINLYLSDFKLPKGVELSFYTSDFEYILPTILPDEPPQNGIYITDYLSGSNMIVELFAQKGVEVSHCFTIEDVGYMYRPLPRWMGGSRGFGDSKDCEVNVNCPEGDNWQDEKKGVARIILIAAGDAWYCTGSLINNVRNDKTPYFLTASHCADGTTEEEFKRWKFYFNYESPDCFNPQKDPNNPDNPTTIGAERIAEGEFHPIYGSTEGSDFLLLKLDDKLASRSDLYYNGWNVAVTPATGGVGIHHPAGDIKKISTYTKPLQQSDRESHWDVHWVQTQTDWGVTEGGSSGSPIFDQNKYIVGTLSYGWAACATPSEEDSYGKMACHWNWKGNGATPAQQLKPWLDPDNTGITKLQGLGEKKPPVFNNPTDSVVYVKLENGENQKLKVYDVMGRLVMEKQISVVDETEIIEVNLWELPAGMYIMVINGNNGRKTHKIIKL